LTIAYPCGEIGAFDVWHRPPPKHPQNKNKKPLMKKLLTAAVMSAALSSGAFALEASDNSSNYDATFIGLNQGTGFNAWTGSGTGGGGNYIGSSGLSSSSFAIFSGGGSGNSFEATRPFSSAMNVGDTFSVQFGYTGVADDGVIGINLFSDTAFRLGIKFTGGQGEWTLNDGGNDFGIGIPWSGGTPGTTLNFSFTRGSENNYSINVSQGSDSFEGLNFTASSGVMSVDRVQFFTGGQGGGENIGFDNLNVVPEPSTYALFVLGAAAMSGYVIRRRRR
jgi:hypothetical protein